MVIAHALRILQAVNGGLSQRNGLDHIFGNAIANSINRAPGHNTAAAHAIVLHQPQLIQNAVEAHTIQHAVGGAGQSHQAIGLGDLQQSAGVHIQQVQGVLAGVIVQNQDIHQAVEIVVSHVSRHLGGISHTQGLASSLSGVVPVALAIGVITVDDAGVTIVVSSDEINGGRCHSSLGHIAQVDVEPVAIAAVGRDVVISVEGTGNVHNDDLTASFQTTARGSDGRSTFCDSGDHTVFVHSGNIFVGRFPSQGTNIIGQVPGQSVGGQCLLLVGAHDYLLLRKNNSGNLGGFGQRILAIEHQQAHILAVPSHRRSGVGPIGGVNGQQLAAVAVVVCPVDDAVSFAIGHGLAIVGSGGLFIGIEDVDGIALSIGNRDQLVGLQIHFVQAAVVILGGVQLAIDEGHGPRHTILAAVIPQLSQLAGEQVDGVQAAGIVFTVIGSQVHLAGGLIKGHIHHIQTDVADLSAAPDTGRHVQEVTAGIHREDVAVHILSSVQSVVLVHVAGDHGSLSGLLVDGSPAEHGIEAVVGAKILMVHLVSIQRSLIHFRIVGAGLTPGQVIDNLVAAVVTQRNSKLVAQIGDINGNGIGAVFVGSHFHVGVVLIDLSTAGVHGDDCSGVCLSEGQGDVVAIFIGGLHDLGGVQHGSGSIDVDGHLIQQHIGLSALVVDDTGDGQVDHVAIFQIGKIIHIVIGPAVDHGNNRTVAGDVHGLGFFPEISVIQLIAFCVGVDHLQFLSVTHQGNVDLGDGIQCAVAIGGDNVICGVVINVGITCFIIPDGSAGLQIHAGVGVHAQHPVAGANIGPQHVGVLVCGNVADLAQPHAVVIPEAAVEQRRSVPTAVEAHEGQAQGDFALAFQIDKAFHIVAAGEVGVDPFLVGIGQLDGDSNLGGSAGSNSNGIAAESHSGIIQCLVLFSQHVVAVVVNVVFAQQAGAQIVSLFGIGEVVHSEGEAKFAVHIVLQLCLGTLAAFHGQVSLSADGVVRIHQAGTLLTGRSLHIVFAVGDDGNSGAHHQAVHQNADLSLGSVGELLLQVLQYQSGNTGNLRCCHGSTAHQAILAIIIARIDIAAHAGDIRHQAQVRSGAPAGEGAHLATVGIHAVCKVRRNGDGLGLGICHGLTVFQSDQNGGDAGDGLGAILTGVGGGHTEGEDILGYIVPNHDGQSACSLSIGALFTEGDFATADHGNLASYDGIAILIIEVFSVAQVGNHHILQFTCIHQIIQCDVGVLHEHFHRVLVEDLGAVGQLEVVGGDQIVVHGANSQGVGVSSGRGHGAVFDVLGQLHIVAPGGAIRAGAFVTGSHINDHIALSDTLENRVDFLDIGISKAGGATQGHVDNVNAQDHAVLQCLNDAVHASAAARAEHLHGNDLCIGGHTDHTGAFHLIGSGDTGNVAAVIAIDIIMQHISGAGSIVECERNLCTVVQVLCGDLFAIELFQAQIVSIQHFLQPFGIPCSTDRVSCEGRMVQIQTGIQNGNGHALTGVAQILPDSSNIGHQSG